MPRLPTAAIDTVDLVSSLRKLYGIEYRAPCDARATGLAADSVDCVTSTSTLEHIDPSDIGGILRECHRILRADGIMSMAVDYTDHYAISQYNFLRYSDRAWKMFNPQLHFQNRQRHADYVRLFEASGFELSRNDGEKGVPRTWKSCDGCRSLNALPNAAWWTSRSFGSCPLSEPRSSSAPRRCSTRCGRRGGSLGKSDELVVGGSRFLQMGRIPPIAPSPRPRCKARLSVSRRRPLATNL